MRSRKSFAGGLATLAVIALWVASVAVAAPAKDGDVRVSGACTKASSAKLKLSQENGRIEVEFEVDQNRVGQTRREVPRQGGQPGMAAERERRLRAGRRFLRL